MAPADALSCALDGADRGGMTLAEIGLALGLTRERIRQIESKGLRNLTAELDRRGLLAAGAEDALRAIHRVVLEPYP